MAAEPAGAQSAKRCQRRRRSGLNPEFNASVPQLRK
jgi:hypothetical protein